VDARVLLASTHADKREVIENDGSGPRKEANRSTK